MDESLRIIIIALAPHFHNNIVALLDAANTVHRALDLDIPAKPDYLIHDGRVQAALSSVKVMDCMREGKKINAIKEVRALTSCNLKDAKDVVEDPRLDAHLARSSW